MLRWGVSRIRNGFSARVGGRASKQALIRASRTVLYGGTKQQASASGGTWGATGPRVWALMDLYMDHGWEHGGAGGRASEPTTVGCAVAAGPDVADTTGGPSQARPKRPETHQWDPLCRSR